MAGVDQTGFSHDDRNILNFNYIKHTVVFNILNKYWGFGSIMYTTLLNIELAIFLTS